jgi:Ca2+-binding EF-hand superfamily protein
LDRFRRSIFEHGARGIIGLGRKFRIVDDDGSGSLDRTEFAKCLVEHAQDLQENEIDELFARFDKDKDGTVDFEEFLATVRGGLNPRRKKMVELAFSTIDANGDGIVDTQDLVGRYDASRHPDVLEGRKTETDVFRLFLDTFDAGDHDGIVHPEEFERYYEAVSASIDDDDYFELMMRNAWHISGGEGWCENTTCRRVLVVDGRGEQSVQEVKNDLDVAGDDVAAMKRNIEAQGVEVASLSARAGVQEIAGGEHAQGSGRRDVSTRKKPASPGRGRSSGGGASSIVLG